MSTTRRAGMIVLQLVLLAAVLVFASRQLYAQWTDVRALWATTQVQWLWIVVASGIVLATYALLIHSWRMLLAGWGGSLSFPSAARIWTIANLGRYLPGKVWSIGALGALAGREGVSPIAAGGAAILGTMLNIGSGFAVLAVASASVLNVFAPWLRSVTLVLSALFVIGTVMFPVVLPPLLGRMARWRGYNVPVQQLPARTLWASTSMNIISWMCYGAAFAAFARGISPHVVASVPLFVVIWTASYLSGYLALFAPGGIGVREVAIGGGLVGLGLAAAPDATLLALASRVWLTALELAPGLLALLWSSARRRRTSSHA